MTVNSTCLAKRTLRFLSSGCIFDFVISRIEKWLPVKCNYIKILLKFHLSTKSPKFVPNNLSQIPLSRCKGWILFWLRRSDVKLHCFGHCGLIPGNDVEYVQIGKLHHLLFFGVWPAFKLFISQLSERKLKTCENETEIELGMKWFSSTDIRLRFFSFFEDCVNKNLQLFERIEKWFYTSNSTYFWYFILFKLSLILVIFHVPPKDYPAIANRDYSLRDMDLIFSCN